MSLLPEISQTSAEINKLVAQANIHQTIAPVNPTAFTDPADTALLASRDPVIREVSVGMTGDAYSDYSVSGTPPLSLPNSLGKPLKAWEVDVLPYQEGTGDPSPDNVRPIHGTDKVTIYTDSKYGGLVEWNQLINSANYRTATTAGITTTISGNNILANGTTTETAYISLLTTVVPTVAGHKYLSIIPTDSETFYYDDRSPRHYSNKTEPFFFVGNGNNISAYVRINRGITVTNKIICQQLFDLTQMFGAGNEPTTLAEFTALFDQPYYPYNAGQQMTVDQVNGAQYSPAVLTLPQTVYTGTIGSEGGESRWGKVDLGTLTYRYRESSGRHIFETNVIGMKPGTSSRVVFAGMCEIYRSAAYNATWVNNDISYGSLGSELIDIVDNRFDNPTDFTTAVSGVKLIYPLATPTTFALTTPTIPTPSGTATTWATAEDGSVESMEVTYYKSE